MQYHPQFEFFAEFPLAKMLKPLSGFVLVHIADSFEQYLEKKLSRLGLGYKKFLVLCAISEIGPISQQRLSDMLQIDRTTMVSIIDSFERLNAVERNSNPMDRRAHALTLTTTGRQILKRAFSVVEVTHSEFFAEIKKDDLKHLQNTLENLLEKIKFID